MANGVLALKRLSILLPWSLAAGLLILASGCGSSGSATPQTPPSPTAEAAASPSPTALPSPPAASGGNSPTGPGPQPGAACPVATVLCEFAVQLEAALEAGNADALFAMGAPVTVECSTTSAASVVLCEGAVAGEQRQGYWVLQGGEGIVVAETELRGGLAPWFDAIARHGETADVYGPGELRVGSISCTRKPDQPKGTCLGNSLQVHFTFINPQQVQSTGLPGQRITFHVSASVVDGVPKVNGFGTVVPPNSVLLPDVIELNDTAGNPLLAEVYPWTP